LKVHRAQTLTAQTIEIDSFHYGSAAPVARKGARWDLPGVNGCRRQEAIFGIWYGKARNPVFSVPNVSTCIEQRRIVECRLITQSFQNEASKFLF
jgi:hypothetical protein